MLSPNIYLFLVALICALCQMGLPVLAVIDLDSICKTTKGKPFGFTSTKQVKDSIELFRADKAKCPAEYHGAFESLSRVVDDDVLSDVCAPLAYDRIKDFHGRYISIYKPEATKEQLDEAKKKGSAALEPIPESLRRFFILFVMQINAQCKRSLVQRLESLDSARLVRDEDFELMETMQREGSRLWGDEYRQQAKRMKDLIILDDDDAKNTKLYVQVRFGDVIKKAKDACEAKFRPVYVELYVPVIKLNNLGYKDKLNTDQENEDLDLEQKYTRWFKIIETCEILKDIEVLQDTSSLSAVADLIQANSLLYANKKSSTAEAAAAANNNNRVTLLSEQEANELKESIANNIAMHSSVSVYEARKIVFEHQKLAFTPRMWILENDERSRERKAFSLLLKQKFHKHKLQVVNKDESSVLGRIAAFMAKHQAGIRLAMAIIGIIVIISIHG